MKGEFFWREEEPAMTGRMSGLEDESFKMVRKVRKMFLSVTPRNPEDFSEVKDILKSKGIKVLSKPKFLKKFFLKKCLREYQKEDEVLIVEIKRKIKNLEYLLGAVGYKASVVPL